jgi:hypothetical protein
MGVAQEESTWVTCVRPWVQPAVPQKKNKGRDTTTEPTGIKRRIKEQCKLL